MRGYMYTYTDPFVVQQKLAQHCKAIICHWGHAFSFCLVRSGGSLQSLNLVPGSLSWNDAHAGSQTFENLSFLPPRSSGVSFLSPDGFH